MAMKIERAHETVGEWHWLVDVERYNRDLICHSLRRESSPT